MIFGRKKTEKPKSPLGLALYKYDCFLAIDLRNILANLRKRKKPGGRKTGLILSGSVHKLNMMLEDISKDNFKTDYRTDKTRDEIIRLLSGFKLFLEDIVSAPDSPGDEYFLSQVEKLDGFLEIRSSIKKKMKDIESDYL